VRKVEVADGDKFGTSSGERAEVYRQHPQGGYGCGDVVGSSPCYGVSIKPESDFILNGQWNIFHQLHADDSIFGQAPFRLQVDNSDPDHPLWEMSIDSGQFVDLAAAQANDDPTTDINVLMLPFQIDQWFDFQYQVHWTTDTTGWVIIEMRKRGGWWQRYVLTDIQTLPRYTGQPSATNIYDKQGYYRGDSGTTPTVHVSYDDYWVGHSFADSPLLDAPAGGDSSVGIFPSATNICPNTDAATNTTGQTNAGGGTTTRTRVTTKGVRGTAYKADSDGGASGQGIFFRNLDGTKFTSVDAGETWLFACFLEGDDGATELGDLIRIGIEWSNSSDTVLSTTFAIAHPLTADPRLFLLQAVAPANSARARLRVSWNGTTDGVFYVSGLTFSQTKYLPPFIPSDNVAGGSTRSAGRAQMPSDLLDEAAFWFAIRMRLAHDYSQAHTFYPLLWGDDGNNLVALQFDGTQWVVKRLSGGSGSPLNVPASHWKRGDYVTVIVCGTASQLKMSEGGDAFTTLSHSTIPTLTAALFDIGSGGTISASQEMAGAIMWAAFGTGYELTDADAVTLAGFTETDPHISDIVDMGGSLVWTGASGTVAGGSSVDLWRRMRITLMDEDRTTEQGVFYLTDPGLSYLEKTNWTQVQFSFVDGMGLQAQQNLPRMNPPDAVSLDDVIAFRRPAFHIPLSDEEGNKAVHHVRRERKRRKHETKRHYRRHGFRHWQTRETRSEAQAIVGQAGNYRGTPLLGEPGLIIGSDETSVRFRANQSEYVRIPVDASDTIDGARLTVTALIKPHTTPDVAEFGTICSGPGSALPADLGNSCWVFAIDENRKLYVNGLGVIFDEWIGDNALTLDEIYFVAFAWDGHTAKMYHAPQSDPQLVVDKTFSVDGDIPNAVNGEYLRIGARLLNGTVDDFYDGWMQRVVVFERGLEEATLQAMVDAAFNRGYPRQTVGERLAAVSESPLWDTANVQLGGPDVQPVFQFGQSPHDELDAAIECEMPHSHYFFGYDGAPVALVGDFRNAAPYNTIQAFLSDDPDDQADGAIYYDDSDVDWDSELYNIVPASRDGGEEIEVRDEDSIAARLEHPFTGATGLLLAEDDDVEQLASAILRRYAGRPLIRPKKVALHGVDEPQREHIFERQIGDLVRFKRRGSVGESFDVVCTILGWAKKYERGQVTCEWNLSRPLFDVSDGLWHLGVVGYSELGETTVLG